MAKFFDLCEAHDPSNDVNPTYALYDFLKSQGIPVSLVRGTNMLYIDTGTQTIPVTIATPEEDAETLANPAQYMNPVKQMNQAMKDPMGMAIKQQLQQMGPQGQQALQKRDQVGKQALDAFNKETDQMAQSLKTMGKKPVIGA